MPEHAPEAGAEREPLFGPAAITAIVCGAALILAAALPLVFPGVDARFALVWGDELADGKTPDFDGAVPAKHPLTLALGALLSLAGPTGARSAYGAISLITFAFLIFATFRLGRAVAGRAAGVAAAALVAIQPVTLTQAVTSGKDLPFVALTMLAASFALEGTERNWKRVLGLLVVAGLIRPEAWLLAGLYGLWLLWLGPPRYRRAVVVTLVALAPAVWVATDVVLTGDPMHTTNHAREKQTIKADEGLVDPLEETREGSDKYLTALEQGIPGTIGWPMTIAGLLIALATLRSRSRGRPRGPTEWLLPRADAASDYPLVILITMVLAGLAFGIVLVIMGLPLVDRFLLIPALILIVIVTTALPRVRETPLLAAPLALGLIGALVALPGNVGETADAFELSDTASREADQVAALARDPRVAEALGDCPKLAFGGQLRARIQLGRTIVGPQLGIRIDRIRPTPPPLLEGPGDSTFAYGFNPRSKLLWDDGRAGTMPPTNVREGRWLFSSLCATTDPAEAVAEPVTP